jgi:glycosyltransferase involved in cell wall biosynthesis
VIDIVKVRKSVIGWTSSCYSRVGTGTDAGTFDRSSCAADRSPEDAMPDAAPVVSVVIPCFNHGHLLGEALESIGAPARDTEIIVVDDGSTDDTTRVAKHFAATSPILVHCLRQDNQGVAAARNRGLAESRGRYVVFLDADDRLAPGAIDAGAGAIDDRPECFFVFGRCRTMSAAGAILPTPVQPRITHDHYRELLRRNFITTPAVVMFRREALELAGGFTTAVHSSADYELYLHVARHHPVCDHGQLVAFHRKHIAAPSGSASQMLKDTLAVLRAQRPFLEGDTASQEAYRQGWRTWQDFYGGHLVNEIRADVADGDWLSACRKGLTLAHYHPYGLAHHAAQKLRVTLGARPFRVKPGAGHKALTHR